MATKNTAPSKGAKKPTATKLPPTRKPRSAIADLDVDERRAFEEWKVERERNAAAWDHKKPEELELEFLKKLNDREKKKKNASGASGKKKTKDCGDNDPCGEKQPKIDLEMLAEKVFFRLIFEARIERERAGWAG